MTEAPMAANAVGGVCWPTNRRTGCCSAGTSAPNGRSRRIRKRPASGRCGSLPRRRIGLASISSIASWNAMAAAGKACATVSPVIKVGHCICSAMPIFSPARPDRRTLDPSDRGNHLRGLRRPFVIATQNDGALHGSLYSEYRRSARALSRVLQHMAAHDDRRAAPLAQDQLLRNPVCIDARTRRRPSQQSLLHQIFLHTVRDTGGQLRTMTDFSYIYQYLAPR